MEVQLRFADGTPAADALVSIAEAPVAVQDVALVADATGRVWLQPPVAGDFVLSVWAGGRAHRLPCALAPGAAPLALSLPA